MLALIGTYTRGTSAEGVYIGDWRVREGRLDLVGRAARAVNPSLLLPASRRIYAVSETADQSPRDEGAVVSYELRDGALVERSRAASGGGLPCALALDADERHLAVANYAGTVALFVLDANGDVGAQAHVVPHPKGSVHPKRQSRGHPHGVGFFDGELWVPDLGGDAVYRYRVEEGLLAPLPPLAVPPGTGPRLIVRHPTLPVCHLVHELSNEVSVWHRDGTSWSIVQRVSTLANGFSGRSAASDIRLSDGGRHLYVSNRGENTVVGYAVATDGTLKPTTRVRVHGEHPRAFTLAPDGAWLLAANRDSNNVTVFRRHTETGELHGPTSELAVPAPACVAFVST